MSDSELQKLRYDNKALREASDRLCSRIEALEAALREIAHDARAEITPSWAAKIARAALAPEQDK
jgi:hypothetical protein